jgi:diguanylate cyclase (GGDEF)-like protein
MLNSAYREGRVFAGLAVNIPPLKLPLSISNALKAFMDTQMDVLPVLNGNDLKALYFKDSISVILGCNNGKRCSETIPNEIVRDIIYINIKTDEKTVTDYLKKAIENETSVAVLMGSLYLGMVPLNKIVSFIHEHKINDAITRSPLTGLPGNYSIRKEFERKIARKEHFYVCYSDINDFKPYNDKYGLAKGDEVIKFNAFVLSSAGRENFVGHIGGDDFMFFLPIGNEEAVLKNIVSEFDKGIINFYSNVHKKQKCIMATDREGKMSTFPIMSVAIAVMLIDKECSFEYVNTALVGLKERVKNDCKKQKGGSLYAFDKRKVLRPD